MSYICLYSSVFTTWMYKETQRRKKRKLALELGFWTLKELLGRKCQKDFHSRAFPFCLTVPLTCFHTSHLTPPFACSPVSHQPCSILTCSSPPSLWQIDNVAHACNFQPSERLLDLFLLFVACSSPADLYAPLGFVWLFDLLSVYPSVFESFINSASWESRNKHYEAWPIIGISNICCLSQFLHI